LQTFIGHTNGFLRANFSPDGKQTTKVCKQLPLKFQSLRLLSLEAEVSSANFSPDGKQIVSASLDKSLKLWDLSGNCLQTFIGHTNGVLRANFSPDGKQIVSASRDICS
jgi:WD40 repeat protein